MGKQESNCPIGDKVLRPGRVVNDAAFIICKTQGQIPSSTPGSCSQLAGVRPHGGANFRERALAGQAPEFNGPSQSLPGSSPRANQVC